MKNALQALATILLLFTQISFADSLSCTDESVQTRLDAGESPISIYNDCNSDISLLYGKGYQGGYIAYLNTEPGSAYGSGFVADKADFPKEAIWMNYGSIYQSANALQTGIGYGKQNTSLIVEKLGKPNSGEDIPPFNYAAWISTLSRDDYSNWYLPSLDEMYQVIKNVIKPMGNCNSDGYWTSSEVTGNYRAAYQVTCVPSSTRRSKNQAYAVRMIRNFSAAATMQTKQNEDFALLNLTGSLFKTQNQQIKSLGFCISNDEFPTTDNLQQTSSSDSAPDSVSFSLRIPYNEAIQGNKAYARACAIISDNNGEVSVYGNQLSITYPQVVKTLAPTSINAYSANLGGQLVADTTGKILRIGITVYEVDNDTLKKVFGNSLRLSGDKAQGIVASGLNPNKSYQYMATAYIYSSDMSVITRSFNGPKISFQTPAPTKMSVTPPGLVSARFTTSEMKRFDFPEGTKSVCDEIINNQKVCPALSTSGAEYIFLSPNDNEWEIVVAKYIWTQTGNKKPTLSRNAADIWRFWGARYNDGVTLNNSAQTIIVTGESRNGTPSIITIQWSTIFGN